MSSNHGDKANDSHVVSKHDDSVGAVGGHTVVPEQRVWERAEYAALKCASVKNQGGGCSSAYMHSLGSAPQEVQDPVILGSVESQVSKLDDKLGGHSGVQC